MKSGMDGYMNEGERITSLAFTGMDLMLTLGVGVGIMLVGLALWFASRAQA